MAKMSYPSMFLCLIIGVVLTFGTASAKSLRKPRQVNFSTSPDGTMTASFAAAQGMPGNSFGMSQSYEMGPRGMSSSMASAMDSNIMGHQMSMANAAANSFQTPFG